MDQENWEVSNSERKSEASIEMMSEASSERKSETRGKLNKAPKQIKPSMSYSFDERVTEETTFSMTPSRVNSNLRKAPPRAPTSATKQSSPDPIKQTEHLDSLTTEFIYYSSALKVIAPEMTREADRAKVIPWIRRLFGPEYQTQYLRNKRNRYLVYDSQIKYLMHLTLVILNDEVRGVFTLPPQAGCRLPEFESFTPEDIPPAAWEVDTMWEQLLEGLPVEFAKMECSVHQECKDEPSTTDLVTTDLLDMEFRFFLHLALPYAALLPMAEDRTRVAAWLQILATVQENSCLVMKGIRNDYMQALLGYLHDLRVTGPFQALPPKGPLQSLAIAAKNAWKRRPFTDPSTKEADDFLATQPIPDHGAFVYVAVSGDMEESNSIALKPTAFSSAL